MKRPHLILSVPFAFLFLNSFILEAPAQVLADGQPSVLQEDRAQPSYVHDLKVLIKKSRENIKSVDVKIREQAVVKRNQKREEKAQEYYQQALKLQEEGRLEEARELFDKAIRITDHPEMRGYIKESEHRAKTQTVALAREEEDVERRATEEERAILERVESSYQTAVTLYKQQNFKEAKDEFVTVDELYPDYKATRSYLQIIGQDIVQQDGLQMKEQRAEIERQQKESEVARLREKELWRKEIEQKEEARKEQLRQQAETVYAAALGLYKDKQYVEAKAKFQEVDWVVPDFKATRAYLNKIDQDIEADKKRIISSRQKELEKERWDAALVERKDQEEREKGMAQKERERLAQVKDQAEFLYVAAVALFEKDLLPQALEKFKEVEALYPSYKSTGDYTLKIEQLTAEQLKREEELKRTQSEQTIWAEEMERKKKEKADLQRLTEEADDLYQRADELYKMGRLIEAKENFLLVDQKVPDYKSCRDRLKQIDNDIELMVKVRRHEATLAEQKSELERLKADKGQAEKLYAEALRTYDAGNFEAAKAKFQEVEQVFPDYKKAKFYLQHIDDDIAQQAEDMKRREAARQAEAAYLQAVKLYKEQSFEEAKRKFLEADAAQRDYKDISNYLERIDDDIIAQKEMELARVKELQIQGPYNEAVLLYQKEEYELAKVKFLEILAVAPDFKDTTIYLEKIDRDIERKKFEEEQRRKIAQAEDLYRDAMTFYRSEDFEQAKDKLVKLEVVWPDYKDVAQYLNRIGNDIALKKQREDILRRSQEADPVYQQGLAAYRALSFAEAKAKLLAVQDIYPDYKDSLSYLARIDQDIRKQDELVLQKEKLRQADMAYTAALNAYARRDFETAKTEFLKTAAVDPTYKSLKAYLSRIDQDIQAEAERLARMEKEREAEEIYSQAVQLYHDQNFAAAREKFLDVTAVLSDYKKARYYLTRIEQEIGQQKMDKDKERVRQAEELFRKAQALRDQGDLVGAFRQLAELQRIFPDYKSVKEDMREVMERLAQEDTQVTGASGSAVLDNPAAFPSSAAIGLTDAQVLEQYKQAVRLFKNNQYDQAQALFEAIQVARPGYRSSATYLESIRLVRMPVKAEKSSEGAAEVPVPTAEKAAPVAVPEVVHVSEEPLALYQEAVALFKSRQYAESRAKFDAVEARSSGYRSTRDYLKNIDQAEKEQEAARERQRVADLRPAPAPTTLSAEDYDALVMKADPIYLQALQLYQGSNYSEAKAKFTEVQSIIPDYKSSSQYLSLITEATGGRSPEGIGKDLASEEARVVRELAMKSKAIYQQIRTLANDKELAGTARSFAQVDRLIADLDVQQKKMAAQMLAQKQEEERTAARRLEQERKAAMAEKSRLAQETKKTLQQEEQSKASVEQERLSKEDIELDKEKLEQERIREQQKEVDIKAEALYQQALGHLRAKQFPAARQALVDLGGLKEDYKDSDGLVKKIERAESEATLVQEDAKDREQIEVLAERANALNLEALQLSKQKDFDGIRQKFDELTETLADIQGVKKRMTDRRDEFTVRWEGRKATDEKKSAAQAKAAVVEEGHKSQAQAMFRQGQQLYAAGEYSEAKVKFQETLKLDPTLKAAASYIHRVERLIEKRDFELQKNKNRDQVRDLQRKEESTEGLTAETDEEKKLAVEERAKLLWDNGTRLYREKRYREARIKFEELQKIGDSAEQQKAQRYLVLIEKGILVERANAEKELASEQKKLLRDLRDQDMIDRQEGKKKPSSDEAEALGVASPKDLDIERNKELRAIEQQNLQERSQKLEQKKDEKLKATREERKEKAKFDASAQPLPEAKEGASAGSKDSDVKNKKEDADPVEVEREKARAKASLNKKIEAQKKVIEKEEKRLQAELDQERRKFLREKELLEKAEAEQNRQKQRVQQAQQVQPVSVPSVPAVPTVEPREDKSVVEPVPAVSRPLKAEKKAKASSSAVSAEQRLLEKQRASIRRDFEAGVERLYNEAVSLYKQRIYDGARADFLQVRDMIKGYKKTDWYLSRIDQALGSEVKKPGLRLDSVISTATQSPAEITPEVQRSRSVSQALDSFEKSVR